MGISEHFEFDVPKLPHTSIAARGSTDYLYAPGKAVDDQWNGLWAQRALIAQRRNS